MKKFIVGAIVGAGIILMLMYCSTGDKKVSTWKPKKIEVITWKKLDTYYKFYEQYVVTKDYIYVLGLFYSPAIKEERMKHLKGMVHEWSPKEE